MQDMSWVGEWERAGQEEKLSSNVIFIVRCELRYGYPGRGTAGQGQDLRHESLGGGDQMM